MRNLLLKYYLKNLAEQKDPRFIKHNLKIITFSVLPFLRENMGSPPAEVMPRT